MNQKIIKALVVSDTPLNEVYNKLTKDFNITHIAQEIKFNSEKVEEFINTFISRKKITPQIKWESLCILREHEAIFKNIEIDKNNQIIYPDKELTKLGIEQYIVILGFKDIIDLIGRNISVNKAFNHLNPKHVALRIISHALDLNEIINNDLIDHYFTPSEFLILNEIMENEIVEHSDDQD